MTLGIDYSMTCPAMCAYTPKASWFWYAHESKLPTLPHVDHHCITHKDVIARAQALAGAALNWASEYAVERAEIEDYAYSATGRVFHIGENTGILKSVFFSDFLTPLIPISPTVIKKFATGKGNADKAKMTAAFLHAYPAAQDWIPAFFPRFTTGSSPAKSPLSDLADAYWIARHAYSLTTGS